MNKELFYECTLIALIEVAKRNNGKVEMSKELIEDIEYFRKKD